MVSINKLYNFNTLAPTIFGSSYSNMKVKGILTSEEAVKYRDINTLHTTVKPLIPNLPINVADCTYILFENIDNIRTLLALEYIDINTLVEVSSTNVRVEIYNTTTMDLSVIKARLLELGYNNISITTFNV